MSVEIDDVGGSAPPTLAPVVKELSVALDRERAFALFTSRVAEWWPLASHSVAGADAVACTFEERVGGRLYESARDGTQHTWGTIIEWQPPARLAMTWHPGRDGDTAQLLEVDFVSDERGTVIRLVHTGWERMPDGGAAERAAYETGWDYVLGFFTAAGGAAG